MLKVSFRRWPKGSGDQPSLPDLMTFAQEHGLKIATIADLIAYRRRNEKLIELVATSKINSRFGGAFDVRVYANKVTYAEHLAIVRGDVTGDEPVYVRVHQHNLLADSLGDDTASVFFRGEARSRAGELEAALEFIAKKDRGVVVLGFPCNDFGGQEPGTAAEIKVFCQENYKVSFPMFDKVAMDGPLYTALTSSTGKIGWNFEKILVGKDGNVITKFSSDVEPESAEITGAIEQALK
jgi:hypothetical protein